MPKTNPTDATRLISPLDFAIVFINGSFGFFVICMTLGIILPVLFWSLVALIDVVLLERTFEGTSASDSMVLKKRESVVEG